jgi:NAD(P)-dependent dehydrogenase (short-subunit alcohol dehydrogenase family)
MGINHKAVIIGAGGGIGQHVVTQLAKDGWSLVLAGRSQESLNEIADKVPDAVESISIVDACDFDAVSSLIQEDPDLKGVVNLAGSIMLKPAHSTSQRDYETTMNLNATSAFSVIRASGRAMRKHGGSVVLMSSCAAQVGLANHEAVSAAKGAVEGMTRSAAATYAHANLRFNAIAPGLTETPLASPLIKNEASRKVSEQMHPLGRIGRPEEIARAVTFLLNPANEWITGQVLGVDGGLARLRGR